MGCRANRRCRLIQAVLRSRFTTSCALYGRRLSFASGPLLSCHQYGIPAGRPSTIGAGMNLIQDLKPVVAKAIPKTLGFLLGFHLVNLWRQ